MTDRPTDLDQIRDRVETDFTIDPDSVTGPLAKELMAARMDRCVLLDEVDRARADLADARTDYQNALVAGAAYGRGLKQARAERDALAATLAAVRELHQPIREGAQGFYDNGRYGYIEPACTTCGTSDEYAVEWPCATVAALGETGGTDA